jgi:hypothetical protein
VITSCVAVAVQEQEISDGRTSGDLDSMRFRTANEFECKGLGPCEISNASRFGITQDLGRK